MSLLQANTLLVSTLVAFVLSGCGGGGSGGGGSAPGGVLTETTVSGSVTAPNGAVAFEKNLSISDVFQTEAYAALTGLAAVPDGTIVQLGTLSSSGLTFTPITTTTTSNGRYAFNLSALGLQLRPDLLVRVANSSGKEMRAFAVGTIADINPVSEVSCQLIVQALANGGALDHFTLQEVSDVTGATGLLAGTQDLGNAVSLDQAIGFVKTAVTGNAAIMNFLTAAAQPGQTTEGTSDVGNFYPFDEGSIWRYRGTTSGVGVTTYDTTVLVNGQGPAPSSGINSTIFYETNSGGESRPQKNYGIKDAVGIMDYGNDDPTDIVAPQLSPYRAVHFPFTPGARVVLVDQSGLNWGQDEDGDGRNETFRLQLVQTVQGAESITVPAGTFPNSLRIDFTSVFVVTFSKGGQATVTQTNIRWHAAGVGKVKEVITVANEGASPITVNTEELEGYVVNGQGNGLRIEVKPSSISIRIGDSKALQATAFDLNNTAVAGLPMTWLSTDPSIVTLGADGTATGVALGTATVTASIGALKSNTVGVTVSDVKIINLATNGLAYDAVSGKLYVSTPGTQGQIIAIDPATGTLGTTAIVGNEPGRLAVSDNGQYLYVSVDNESVVKRLLLPTLATNLMFSLQTWVSLQPGDLLCARDMKVIPGNPQGVVITVARHGSSSGGCLLNEPDVAAVYQSGVSLPNSLSGTPFVHLVEFTESSSVLLGLGIFSPADLVRVSVTPSGLSVIDSSLLANWPGREFKYLSGLVYTASGIVLNPTTYSAVGSWTNTGVWSLRPDVSRQRLFTVGGGITPDDTVGTIQAVDLTTLTPIGSLDVRNLNLPAVIQLPRFTDLVRWGPDGLAFRTSSNEVVIIRSPLVSS